MANILATWIHLDTQEAASHFPSSKGLSSDVHVQAIYWRCVACFFTTARFYNKDLRLALFSNVSELPKVEGVAFKDLLAKLNVEFYSTPFEYMTPEGYYKNWRNQFYEFSIFKFVTAHPAFSAADNFMLLDSDCIINGDLTPVFDAVQQHQCITHIIYYKPNKNINGLSRMDMKEIFERLSGQVLDEPPHYHAGEFYASTIKTMKKLMEDFYPIWDQLLRFHKLDQPRLNEEAHVLSYLYFINGFKGGQAYDFIKRIWTDPAVFRNVEEKDKDLLIWHVPSEKRIGFKNLFERLKQRSFNLQSYKADQLNKELQIIFTIPDIPLRYQLYYYFKKLGKDTYKKLSQ